jgi:phosphoribosyl 1,2-cyclic phosphodiesterase
VIGDGARRVGVLTDLGVSTPHVEACLSGCDALVLECNHDLAMLEGGTYPYQLKKRIASRLGHLDNLAAAELLARLDTSRLVHIFAAHLSQQNNTRELARAALAGALGCALDWIGVAEQDAGFGWRDL